MTEQQTVRAAFPELLRDILIRSGQPDDPLTGVESFSCESHRWGNTCMGFDDGLCGQAITPGWIVTIHRTQSVEVWHVSAFGGARLRSEQS